MAIREEHDFLSENERAFLFSAIHDRPHVRADGRELMQQRKVRLYRFIRERRKANMAWLTHNLFIGIVTLRVRRSACSFGEQRSRRRQRCSLEGHGAFTSIGCVALIAMHEMIHDQFIHLSHTIHLSVWISIAV